MKHTLTAIAIALAAFGAGAQTTIDSTSGSNSAAGANSGSTSAVQSQNSGNTSVTATGNQAQSGSMSGSQSGASSDSRSGALGNVINLDQSVPSQQTINQNVSGTTNQNSTNNTNVTGGTNNTSRETYDGTQRIISSGGTNNVTTENVRYSGSYTVKSAPAIAMSGPASGPCTGVSGGLGLSGPGWGVGLNGSAVMVDCRLRENTRVLGMGMQSLDGAANPQEKGEATVMFMDAMRALAAYNQTLYQAEAKAK